VKVHHPHLQPVEANRNLRFGERQYKDILERSREGQQGAYKILWADWVVALLAMA